MISMLIHQQDDWMTAKGRASCRSSGWYFPLRFLQLTSQGLSTRVVKTRADPDDFLLRQAWQREGACLGFLTRVFF